MSDRKWIWAQFNGAISHLVCAGLFNQLTEDLKIRGCELAESESCKKLTFDMPGMVHMKRPWEKFQFMGVQIEIPCEDVATFIVELEELQERYFNDKVPYYKLHGFYRAIVFTPAQRTAFLDMLKARVIEAEERASLFYADKKPASEVLREAAALSTGKPVEEIPNLGGNKNARFHSIYDGLAPKDNKDLN